MASAPSSINAAAPPSTQGERQSTSPAPTAAATRTEGVRNSRAMATIFQMAIVVRPAM